MRKRAQHLVLRVIGVNHLANRAARVADEIGISIKVARADDKAGRVQKGVDLSAPMQRLTAHIFFKPDPTLGRITRFSEEGRERREVVKRDV